MKFLIGSVVIVFISIYFFSIFTGKTILNGFDLIYDETKSDNRIISQDGKLKIIIIKTKQGDIRISQYQKTPADRDFMVFADKDIVAPNGFISYEQVIAYNAYLNTINKLKEK